MSTLPHISEFLEVVDPLPFQPHQESVRGECGDPKETLTKKAAVPGLSK
jgi:hypothetical protein